MKRANKIEKPCKMIGHLIMENPIESIDITKMNYCPLAPHDIKDGFEVFSKEVNDMRMDDSAYLWIVVDRIMGSFCQSTSSIM